MNEVRDAYEQRDGRQRSIVPDDERLLMRGPVHMRDLPRIARGVHEVSRAEVEEQMGRYRDETEEERAERVRIATVLAEVPHQMLLHVDADMCSLIIEAANDLPECHLGRDLWPAESGLVTFATPIDLPGFEGLDRDERLRATVRGLYWVHLGGSVHVALLDDLRAYAIFNLVLLRNRKSPDEAAIDKACAEIVETLGFNPKMMVRAIASYPTDRALDMEREDIQNPASAFILSTLWLLMQNDGIATVRTERAKPVERRRAARRGEPSPDVRVVEIRSGTAAAGAHSADEATRAYHHRWMVRGHWRRQWVPSLNMHRPTYIAPYIKGPEGAPLLTGEKVHRWAGK